MQNQNDPDRLKIPAFMRNKAIVSQVKQRLILTALDRKEAGLKHNSKKALAPIKSKSIRNSSLSRIRRSRKVRTSNSLQDTQSYNAPRYSQPDFLEPYIAPSYGQTNAPIIEPVSSNSSNDLPPKMVCVGTVTQYISKINVAIIMLSGTLKQGDTIAIMGENFLSFQKVEEIQIDRQPVPFAQKGDHIGLKVNEPAATNGKIYRFQY